MWRAGCALVVVAVVASAALLVSSARFPERDELERELSALRSLRGPGFEARSRALIERTGAPESDREFADGAWAWDRVAAIGVETEQVPAVFRALLDAKLDGLFAEMRCAAVERSLDAWDPMRCELATSPSLLRELDAKCAPLAFVHRPPADYAHCTRDGDAIENIGTSCDGGCAMGLRCLPDLKTQTLASSCQLPCATSVPSCPGNLQCVIASDVEGFPTSGVCLRTLP